MRIDFVNQITGESAGKELPPRKNPVWIGHHPENDLVLKSPFVGGEAGVIDNDVAGGEGWRFWNRNGKAIKVNSTVLSKRDHYVRLRSPRVTVECWPYVLTVSFAPDELAGDKDDARRLDTACAQLVREVHKHLVELHPDDPAERSEWLRDSYIHELEQQIEELTGQRPAFPADDLTQTELGNHLAGVAVRSALVQRLVARAGVQVEKFQNPQEASTWGRMRIGLPELERELDRLVEAAHAALGLSQLSDLSEQMAKLQREYWPFWYERLNGKSPLVPRVRRYLALRRVKEEIKDIWFGFGPLEDLLEDPSVSEIMVVDTDHIFIEKNGVIEDSGRRFLTDPLTIIQRIMARANRQINIAQPMADARMPDGSRVNAIIEPLALKGPCLTIRRFPQQRVTITELVDKFCSLTPAARDFLQAAVISRRNVIVSGGTGTGKTTMLNCLSEFIPDKERIVTIEDTAELQLHKEHVVTLQGRQTNLEGAGAVTIRDLVRNALRMRPDRIVVGECRSGEAIDMLQAMNTGHDGSMTTLHANSPAGVIRRLEVLVQQNADSNLPVESIHQQIASAVDLIVQLTVQVENGKKRKVVSEITEVAGAVEGGVALIPIFQRARGRDLKPTGRLPSFLPELIALGLVRDPVDFVRAVEG